MQELLVFHNRIIYYTAKITYLFYSDGRKSNSSKKYQVYPATVIYQAYSWESTQVKVRGSER